MAAWVTLRLVRWRASRRGRHHQRRGLRAERRAERQLRRAGYRILERQPSAKAHIVVDGQRREMTVSADLLAAKDGLRYLVEVKAGRGRSPTTDRTRRQLLEYALVFEVDGMLLVDAAEERIMHIAFDHFAE